MQDIYIYPDPTKEIDLSKELITGSFVILDDDFERIEVHHLHSYKRKVDYLEVIEIGERLDEADETGEYCPYDGYIASAVGTKKSTLYFEKKEDARVFNMLNSNAFVAKVKKFKKRWEEIGNSE